MSNYQAVTVINEPGMVLPSSMTTEVGVSLFGELNPETLVRTRSTALSSVTPRHEKVAKNFPPSDNSLIFSIIFSSELSRV